MLPLITLVASLSPAAQIIIVAASVVILLVAAFIPGAGKSILQFLKGLKELIKGN